MFLKKMGLGLFFLCLSPLIQAEDLHTYRLQNGLQILVKPDHRAPVVVSQVWYKVGGSDEPNGLTGISHALEHMMFRGTPRFGPNVLEQRVAANGGIQNAFTDSDFTAYYQLFPAEKLPISFEIEADRMRHLLLRAEDFEKEIQVVREERRMRVEDTTRGPFLERVYATAFISNPYHNPVVGWEPDLEQMTVEDLRHWYNQWYYPNNAVLVVVGDVDPDQVYRLAKLYFGPLKPGKLPVIKRHTDPDYLGQHILHFQGKSNVPWLLLAYPAPSLKLHPQSNDPYALALLRTILSAGENARLNRRLVRNSAIVTEVDADYSGWTRFDSLFMLSATPAPGHTAEEVKQALLDEIADIQKKGVSTEELTRAKTQLTASETYRQDSIEQQAYELGQTAAINLPLSVRTDYLSRIQAVTAEKIKDVATRYFHLDNAVITYLHPHVTHHDTPRV